jgi:hypothetical protein
MHVHDCFGLGCEDRSYHISAMMSEGPSIQDAADIAVRLRRLEGVVTAVMVADRQFIVETRMPWESIEPEVLIILNDPNLSRYAGSQRWLYNNRERYFDRLLQGSVDALMDPNFKESISRDSGYISKVRYHMMFEQPALTREGDSGVVIDGGSMYGSQEGMITYMGGKPDEPHDTIGGMNKEIPESIWKEDRHYSPPTSWGFEDGGKYARPR